jgi:hypothetical protein
MLTNQLRNTLVFSRGSSTVEVPATASKTGDDIVVSVTATVGPRDTAQK